MNRLLIIILLCCLALLPLACGEAAMVTTTTTVAITNTTARGSSALIQPSDLIYLGVFRLPAYPVDPGYGWEWGGNALTYYPGGDPGGSDSYPGSLFGSGNDQRQQVAEISIPGPVNSSGKVLGDLNTASLLQNFSDVRAGIPALEQLFSNSSIMRAGLEYLPAQGAQSAGKLYVCFGAHYQDDLQNVASHMWCNTDLSNRQGSWWIDHQSLYSVNDYMFSIPDSWANSQSSTSGQYLATGRFRDGGWSGQGPALFAIAPWTSGNPPTAGATLDATTLLLYSNTRGGDTTDYKLNGYHESDEWSGGAWLTLNSKSAVIFIGTKGLGSCWYGYADGTVHPTDGSPFTGTVPPYPNDDRGWWSTSFEAEMIFYSPDDLASVASGSMEAYEPQPYATLKLDQYLWNIDKVNHPDFNVDQNKYRLGACAFDRTNSLLYIVEYRGDSDNDRPLMHVFRVN
ncbi:MAG: hypothetical protein JW782_05575 [Candidatus Saganbacteria bacterium]|nr:hypothetical protein [Candidatus Saganbacteria bacterium]